MDTMKRNWVSPVKEVQVFVPQEYVADCEWRATLHCGVYGTINEDFGIYRSWNDKNGWEYWYKGHSHGTPCQNTVVTVKKDKNGNYTVTGRESGKGSLVTYAHKPTFDWGTIGVSAPSAPTSNAEGSLNSLVTWDSTDINGTGEYMHIGYVKSWEVFPAGSNVS